MARGKAERTEDLSHRWFLREWAELRGRKQSDLARGLGWSKAKISALWTGDQQYQQEHIDQAAYYLGIEPWELLIPPDRAQAIRELEKAAVTIAAAQQGRMRA